MDWAFETNRAENNRNVNAEARPGGCGMDPYVVDHDKSKCVDQQILKLQESPDDVPVGELPRHVLLSADRELTNRVVPGSRATIMGIYSVFQSKPGVSIWNQTLVCHVKLYSYSLKPILVYRRATVQLLSEHHTSALSESTQRQTPLAAGETLQTRRKRSLSPCPVNPTSTKSLPTALPPPFSETMVC